MPLVLLLAAPLLAGCPNTDAAVFVAPTIESPAVAITGNSLLGSGIKGSFKLTLHLGARASGPSSVSVPTFSIEDAKGSSSILPLAAMLTSVPELPVNVEPDTDVDVSFTFDSGSKPIDKDLVPKLCDAAGVTIGGTVQDSLQDSPTPVDSAVIHATGCP